MSRSSTPPNRFGTTLAWFPAVAGVTAMAVGVAALAGWQWELATLKSVLPGFVAMNPLTATAFILAGASLMARRYGAASAGTRLVGLLLAAGVLIAGALKLSDVVLGSRFELDQWLFHARLDESGVLPPNRMAPNTALNFTLLGLALLTIRVELRWRLRPAQLIALIPLSFAFMAVLGYALHVHQLYGVPTFIPMALNTALTFALLCMAVLFAYPECGITRVFVAPDAGGAMARRAAPLALVVPAVLAWIRFHAQQTMLSPAEVEYGVSVMVFSSSLLLTGLLWFSATRLSHAEASRVAALTELQEAHRVLDQRVRERTAELEAANERLRSEVEERARTEDALRRSDAQLRHSQKMEAIGRLAGGIAHDFNNLLTAIMGFGQLVRYRLEPTAPALGDIDEIVKAAERAATLTRQLLAFSRQQVLEPRVLDLNTIVADLDKMIRRLIGEDIDLLTVAAEDLGRVKADPGQLEQVLMNLVVNARDAMPEGGKLTIETANLELTENYAQARLDDQPGRYVMVAVSDTGCGMSREVAARIFEPFYTTKEQGKGTGLGLSTVHGIVKQSEGHIEVYSELGHGTTFKIYLPRVEQVAEDAQPGRPLVQTRRGHETVLLVEDEEVIRRVVTESLSREGYRVIAVEDGSQAIALCERADQVIDLLVTDVVMPLMSGPQLVQRIAALRPDLPVLFVSGYTDRALIHRGERTPGTAFLQKPFAPDVLARTVREVLDGPPRAAAA